MSEIPDCPRCKTNMNVIRTSQGFRCTRCKKEFHNEEQQRLF